MDSGIRTRYDEPPGIRSHLKGSFMKSLTMFLLEAWYLDCRKNVPATVSKRVNAGIRSFENSSVEVQKAVELAKNSAAAADARRRRSGVKAALAGGKRRGTAIVKSPCHKRDIKVVLPEESGGGGSGAVHN